MKIKNAYFGGGCFWCTESYFLQLKGVLKVESGYAGGNTKSPSYKEVCSGLTGHAELVRIEYDEDIISYIQLLSVFFATHDPTTLNRQGADVGTQYRSVIFYQTKEEEEIAAKYINDVASSYWDNPIVTELSPLPIFYPAEAYHQSYYKNNPNQGYCKIVIDPKVAKLRTQFADLIKSNG